MGVSSSSLESDGPSPPSKALHVLRVSPDSPAAQTDIDPFFDFVVGIDGDELSSSVDAATLGRIVEQHEGKVLPLVIWSAKYRNMRVVPVTPSSAWSRDSTASAPDARPSLLGLTMRLCSPEHALENVWHILEVLENSPAESAGLVPYGDWIIGWSGGALTGENAFYELVESHIDKPLRAVVYSYDFDTIREVVLVPNRKWGGEGLLGCGVGYGLLHRIPPQPVNPESMEAILRQNLPYDERDAFRDASNQGDVEKSVLFVPADDDEFEFGGSAGQPMGFEGQQAAPLSAEFDETPVAHWHSVNNKKGKSTSPQPSSGHSHDHHGHSHSSHDHSHGHSHDDAHSHSHSHSPTAPAPSHSHSHSSPHANATHPSSSRRTDSISSLKSIPKSPASPPPRAATPTQSGVPQMSHTFAFREARNSLNGIIKPEPLRKLSSPPAGTSRQKMRGGIVHSPAHSGAGTPTRVKSPEATPPGPIHVDHDKDADDGSDSTSRQPASPGGSITSID